MRSPRSGRAVPRDRGRFMKRPYGGGRTIPRRAGRPRPAADRRKGFSFTQAPGRGSAERPGGRSLRGERYVGADRRAAEGVGPYGGGRDVGTNRRAGTCHGPYGGGRDVGTNRRAGTCHGPYGKDGTLARYTSPVQGEVARRVSRKRRDGGVVPRPQATARAGDQRSPLRADGRRARRARCLHRAADRRKPPLRQGGPVAPSSARGRFVRREARRPMVGAAGRMRWKDKQRHLIRHPPRVRSADATCPPCGTRKNLRACADPRFFRPLR